MKCVEILDEWQTCALSVTVLLQRQNEKKKRHLQILMLQILVLL